MAKLDHIMYATPDLDQGIAELAALTGVQPAVGGSHPGMGTRNALMSLGSDQYLEIIAPDPEQTLAGTLGEELVQHGGSGVRGWAVAASDLAPLHAIAKAHGLEPRPLLDMSRTTPEGVRLDWQLFFPSDNRLLPFFIDWQQSPHPALSTPTGCTLSGFTVSVPEVDATRALMDALGVEVDVVSGEAGLSAELDTPAGIVTLEPW